MTTLSSLTTEVEAVTILRVRIAKLRKWHITAMSPRFVRAGVHLVRYDPTDLAAFLDRGLLSSSSDATPVAA